MKLRVCFQRQERLDFPQQIRVPGTGFLEKRCPTARFTLLRRMIEFLDLLPAFRRHKDSD